MHLEGQGSPNIYTCQDCKCQIFVQVSSVNYGMSSHTNGMKRRNFLYCLLPFHGLNWNKTSIQWTSGSQIYLNSKKIIFGQKWLLNKKIKE